MKRLDWTLGVGVAALALYVLVYPLLLVRYPPITDLPMHASCISIVRHYFDPAYHFREQFTLHPIEVPYLTMYALGAALATIVSVPCAAKFVTCVMLAMMPAGLGVLFASMGKSPLLGMLGLGLAWCTLSQWGMANDLGSLGLYAMSIGCAIFVLEEPTRFRRAALAFALLGVFVTHVFRYPFALGGVCVTALLLYPATRRLRPIAWPIAPSLAAFAVWLAMKPHAMSAEAEPVRVHVERLAEIAQHLFGAYAIAAEAAHARRLLWTVGGVAVVSGLALLVERRRRPEGARALRWRVGVEAVPIVLAGASFAAYLVLPMSVGMFWYVYAREITTAAFLGLGAMPDLPRTRWLRCVLVLALAVGVGGIAHLTASEFAAFEPEAESMARIIDRVPRGSKVMYLVLDHSGTDRALSPFVHMPAWIQAEKGGWLSYHFASTGISPIRYRVGGDIPPPVPERWEWTPWKFDVERDGGYFDTFLVRAREAPSELWGRDRTIRFEAREGEWWLYRRSSPPASRVARR